MGYIPSRAFKNSGLFHDQTDLVTYSNMKFPLPHNLSCHKFRRNPKLTSHVMSLFRGEALSIESLYRMPKQGENIEKLGPTTAKSAMSTPTSTQLQPVGVPPSSSALQPECGLGITATELNSKFKHSHKRLWPSPRPANWLEN